jgi:diketogulonate reductase-like aldo/keto reductase
MDTIKLYNKVTIPIIGMGTWPLKGESLIKTMKSALQIGYSLFDTADNYDNEEAMGEVMKDINRKNLFIITKISDEMNPLNYVKQNALPWSTTGKYFYKTSPYMKVGVKKIVNDLVDTSLHKLKTDYIDCLLMHWPYPDYFLEIWNEMIALYKEGKLRSIGVCNCRVRHLEKLKSNFPVIPMINQICVTPLDTKQEVLNYCNDNHIKVVCYSPFIVFRTRGMKEKESEVINNLLNKYNVSLNKLILQWNVQQGIIPIPASSNISHLKDNFAVNTFTISTEDMFLISSLNINYQSLPESCYCPGI